MHILATFATLCCQTRWPRNHSCTTQEHVSFFSDIFGNTSKTDGTEFDISTFFVFFHFLTNFDKNRNFCANLVKNNFSCSRMFSKRFLLVCNFLQMCKSEIHKCANVQMCKCANVQMCKKPSCTKCANLQRKYFSKCRNVKSANAQFFWVQVFVKCKFSVHSFLFCVIVNKSFI